MWKVTFTYRGYIAEVFYIRAATECEAIECAAMGCSARWATVRVEKV